MISDQIYVSKDGSHSIISGRFGESYHSRHGAIEESLHVFIQQGLLHLRKERRAITVLEFGFGTGLNALLTWQAASNDPQLQVDYTGLERYPISMELVSTINYPELLQMPNQFQQLHELDWDRKYELDESFHFTKILRDFRDLSGLTRFDLIYYDPFAPSCQPEMWQEEQLIKVYQVMKKDAILVTYCAKGSFRRALQQVGYLVERLPGPPGKREMIRAVRTG